MLLHCRIGNMGYFVITPLYDSAVHYILYTLIVETTIFSNARTVRVFA